MSDKRKKASRAESLRVKTKRKKKKGREGKWLFEMNPTIRGTNISFFLKCINKCIVKLLKLLNLYTAHLTVKATLGRIIIR